MPARDGTTAAVGTNATAGKQALAGTQMDASNRARLPAIDRTTAKVRDDFRRNTRKP
jgi:hypothetical protein